MNLLFFIGLLLLMIGGVLFVLKGGMYTGIIYSFRRFYKSISKMEEYVSEQTGDPTERQIKSSLIDLYTYPIIISGASLFFFTLIASII
ncbi:DUF3899 domain-containing protein [Cytobacillus solani]|nr:DUF3899 domain-containing protein [Cytobacillus solani]USK57638.1 DUF3899 domain-containing protein [Cytobacillus solani]